MGDILKYRIPGQEIEERFGSFTKCHDTQELKGFVVSDFEQRELYVFQESQAEPMVHLSKEYPFVMSQQEYEEIATVFLASFRRFGVEKAVFSRIKEIDLNPIVCQKFFDSLVAAYPNAFVYFISSELFGTWIGATPERLISIHEGKGSTVSLAGTKKADDGSPWGEKELREQQYVTDFILERLNAMGMKDVHSGERYESIAGPVKHLKNDIEFSSENSSALDLALDLHPTPAVSGFPRKDAIKLIAETEPHQRGLYTGFIGFIGDDSSDIFVNLRCCSIAENKAYLYLGGGFTSDSSIPMEWQETENKSRTLLNILQNL